MTNLIFIYLSIKSRYCSSSFLLCGKWDKPIPSRSSRRAIEDNSTWNWVGICREKFFKMTWSNFPSKIGNIKLMSGLPSRSAWTGWRRFLEPLCKFNPNDPPWQFLQQEFNTKNKLPLTLKIALTNSNWTHCSLMLSILSSEDPYKHQVNFEPK